MREFAPMSSESLWFVPICCDFRSCLREFVPICSDLFRFVFRTRTNQGNPFLPTPVASPEPHPLKTVHTLSGPNVPRERTKPIHAGNASWGINIRANTHAGPAFALARMQENMFEEFFWKHICQMLGGFSVFAPVRTQENILANLCIGFLRRPNWGFFCPEIRAFTGFWGEISSTVSKVLSDRKALFKHKEGR